MIHPNIERLMLFRTSSKTFLQGVTLIFALLFTSTSSFSQCGQFAEGDTIMVQCGDSATLTAYAPTLTGQLFEDFNDQTIGSGFVSSSNPDLGETCKPSLDSTPYAWFGPSSTQPRSIRTIDIPSDSSTQVCFDLRFAVQSNSSPCEGPDLPDEGVSLQYSSDSGSSWTEIHYFNPDTACCGCGGGCGGNPPSPFVDWDHYCFSLPNSAAGSSIRFRWYQKSGSNADFDHWGLDNLEIKNSSSDSVVVYDWGNGITDRKDSSFVPTDSSSYTATVIDTVNDDTCTASAYVGYDPLQVSIDPSDPAICGSDSITLNAERVGGNCQYLLSMYDSLGNGWNGAEVKVYGDGKLLSSHAVDGYGSVDTISTFGVNTLSLEYISGSADMENGYSLIGPSKSTLFQDGPGPQPGIAYTDSIACNGPGNYKFDWNPATALTDTSGPYVKTGTDTPIAYSVTVQDSVLGFCSVSDTVHVDTGAAPVPVINSDSAFCANGNDTLSLSGSYPLIVWDDSIPASEFVVDGSYGKPTQTHHVTVTDSNGCTGSDTVQLAVKEAKATAWVKDDTLMAGNTGTSYQWVSCDSNYSPISGATSPSYYPSSSGKYALVLSKNGCKDTSACKSSLPGSVWKNVGSGFPSAIQAVHFVDSTEGWIVTDSGQIVHTWTSASNWSVQLDTSVTLHSIEFANDSTGWVVGANGTVLYTDDGGNNWTPQNPGVSDDLHSVDVSGTDRAWTVGKNGTTVRTSDGGTTWNTQNSGTSTDLFSVFFLSQDSGWSVGANGTVLRTTDGGSNWGSQASSTFYDLNGVQFVNDTVGWTVGNNGTILVSNDAGFSWNAQASGTNEDLKSVHFVNDSVGWIVGANGTILHTTDGRAAWASQADGDLHGLNDIHFTQNGYGWIGGSGGTLLRMKGSSVDDPTTVREKGQGSMVRVYPNPVKDRLRIDHRGVEEELSFTLLNSVGQHLRTQEADEEQGRSSLKVRDLETGIYFLKIERQGRNGQLQQRVRKIVVE